MAKERSPVLTGTIHEPYKSRSKWDKREALFTGATGLPLLRGEDAFPVCEVLDIAEDLRVTVLAVADGIGSGYKKSNGRIHGFRTESGLYGVTAPRLAAELAISGLPAMIGRLDAQDLQTPIQSNFQRMILSEVRTHWRSQAEVFAQSEVILGTSEDNIYQSNGYSYLGFDYIFGSTTVTLILGVEKKDKTEVHVFKWGDSPFLVSVGNAVLYSKDLIKSSHLLSSYLVFGAKTFASQASWFSDLEGKVYAATAPESGPISIAAFSDAHAFHDEDDVFNNWAHHYRHGLRDAQDLQRCLNQQSDAGDRSGMYGDDLSGAIAVLRPGERILSAPIFDKI